MKTWEETQKVSEYPRTSRKTDAIDIEVVRFHDIIRNLRMKFCIFETIGMDQTLKGGQTAVFCDDETMRAILPKYLSPLPHPVPILASLDPSCEHFHSERFEFTCSDCERYF